MMKANEKKQKAIDYLKKIGFLVNYNDLELYHGRVKMPGENDWFVKNNVDNSNNKTRDNIMGVPCLCVANYDIAESYAKGSSLNGQSGKMEIHEIVSLDYNSLIVNEKFKLGRLSQNDLTKFYSAIRSLSKGSVKNYCKDIDNYEFILNEIKSSFGFDSIISMQDELVIFDNINKQGVCVSEKSIEKIVSAINAYNWFNCMPVMAVSDYVFLQGEKRNCFPSGGYLYRQDLGLIRKIFDDNNIIALEKKSFSSDRDHIVYVFNLDKVQSLEHLQKDEKEK